MGTVGEMLQANTPCKCGKGDIAYGDFYKPEGRVLMLKCVSCGQLVEGRTLAEATDAWAKANPRQAEPECEPEVVGDMADLIAGRSRWQQADITIGGDLGDKLALGLGIARDVETATDIEYAQRVAGTSVRSDLARAAVLLRELADIVERAARVRP